MAAEQKKLPEGWAKTRLKEVTHLRNEKIEPRGTDARPYLSLEHIESGTNRIINYGSSEEVKSIKTVFYSGDVLYGKLRPYLNKVCQPQFDGVCSTDILVFGPSRAIESSFLMRFLSRRETIEYANMHSKGIDLPRVSANQLGELELTLPPLSEQRRIIARIEELQTRSRRAREALESIPDLLEQLRQSILAAAFRGDLTRKWREQNPDVEPASELLKRIRAERRKRWETSELEILKARGLIGDQLDAEFTKRRKQYKEPEPVDTTDLPELPKGWCWVSWDQLTSLVTSGSRFWSEYYAADGPMFIRAQDINTDELDLDNVAHVNLPKRSDGHRTQIRMSDLLVTITGANVTRSALVRYDLIEAYVSQHVALVRPVDEGVSVLMHLWATSIAGGRGRLLDAAYGGGKPGLNLDNIRNLPMPLPSVKEMRCILLYVHDALQQILPCTVQVETASGQLDNLDQCILTKAFRGELVPQDPNDEPASVLLERIRQEKIDQTANQKSNGKRKGK